MDIKDFRKLLETNNDKFSVFANIEILRKYNFNAVELAQAIKDFLSDEEKAKLFELEHFKKLSPRINYLILKTITDSKIKLQILKTSHIVDGFQSYEIKDLIKSLDSSSKLKIIQDLTFFKEQKIDNFFIQNLIEGLDSKDKLQLLEDKNFVQNELQLNKHDIQRIIEGLESDETKTKAIEEYQSDKYLVIGILKKYSNKSKIDIILNKKFAQNYQLDKLDLENLISSLDIDVLENFLKEQKDFLQNNDIKIYSIIKSLNEEQQLEFLTEFENLGLTLDEKRQILVILKDEAKERLDKSKLPQEYLTALSIHVQNDFGNISTFGKIIPDLNKDLTIYQGLDKLFLYKKIKV